MPRLLGYFSVIAGRIVAETVSRTVSMSSAKSMEETSEKWRDRSVKHDREAIRRYPKKQCGKCCCVQVQYVLIRNSVSPDQPHL